MSIASVKSSYFLRRALESYKSCRIELNSGKSDSINDNCFSLLSIDAYIMSVTALEAFINECIAFKRSLSGDPTGKLILDILKNQRLIDKYRNMPILLWGKSFDVGKSPFQDFDALVQIRNDLIHYKMPFYDGQNKPKWADTVEREGILLSKPVVSNFRLWSDEICTLKGAKWAYNTSVLSRKYVDKVVSTLSGLNRQLPSK
jgi:hypothetical protein